MASSCWDDGVIALSSLQEQAHQSTRLMYSFAARVCKASHSRSYHTSRQNRGQGVMKLVRAKNFVALELPLAASKSWHSGRFCPNCDTAQLCRYRLPPVSAGLSRESRYR